MNADFHTIVLGLGAMGSAAAAQLARRLAPRGERVLGLEQFDVPHAMGSSHGQSRLIRLAYYEHPDYVPLLRRAYALWRELEKETGCRLLHVTGGLYLGRADHELIAGSLASARRHGLAHELLTAPEVQRRFPQFHPAADHVGFFEPDAGFLLPEKAVAAHASMALRHGAELRAHEAAVDWAATPSGVTVRTAHHTYQARQLIITAGPWAGRMLPFIAEKIRVTRQVMLWFWPKQPEAFILGQFPCWCAASEAGGLVYGPPMLPEEPAPLGLKVSHHFPGVEADADAVVRAMLPGDADVARAMLAAHIPSAAGPILSHKVCLYSNSPDHHFVIDHHPHHRNVWLATGFSGHGFKFAPVIGEILADLAVDGRTGHPVEFLRLARIRNT
jgi:sarcosine oxidase